MSVKIRQITKREVPEIHRLLRVVLDSVAPHYPQELIEAQWAIFDAVEDLERHLLHSGTLGYVAIDGEGNDEKVIGFIWGYLSPAGDFLGEWGGVAPTGRRQHVFSTLLKAVESELRRRGIFKFWFYVSASNEPAIRCYRANGYVLEGTHPNHFYGWDFLTFGKIIRRRNWSELPGRPRPGQADDRGVAFR